MAKKFLIIASTIGNQKLKVFDVDTAEGRDKFLKAIYAMSGKPVEKRLAGRIFDGDLSMYEIRHSAFPYLEINKLTTYIGTDTAEPDPA